jgi:hypothetical protein
MLADGMSAAAKIRRSDGRRHVRTSSSIGIYIIVLCAAMRLADEQKVRPLCPAKIVGVTSGRQCVKSNRAD